MEENLEQLEATYGAPASLFKRSAAARASASGSTIEAVLAQWVGNGAMPEDEAEKAGSPVGELPAAGRQTPVADAPSSATSALTGAARLAAVAEARRMPASLIERSAKARASATGGSVEDVLQEWAAEEGLGDATSPVTGHHSSVEEAGSPVEDPPAASAGALTGAALLAAVAEARGMPESLVQRSAAARAKTAGVDVDDVLREWAEEEGLDVGGPAPTDASESPTVDAESPVASRQPPAEDGAVAASGPLSGAALLSAVAAARKMPESLVQRSAAARAKTAGVDVDDVLREWAEEEGLDVGGPAPTDASESPTVDAESPVASRQPPAEDGAVAASGPLSGAALLSAVAAARRCRSRWSNDPQARAKTAGVDVDDVLREWAEEEGLDVGGPAPTDASESPTVDAESPVASRQPPAEDGAVAASGPLSGAALLSAVAAARKMPESLVERSAKARSKQTDASVDDVLLEWAEEEGVVLSPVVGPSSAAAESRELVSATDQSEDTEELSDATAADTRTPQKAAIPSPPEIEPLAEPEPEEPDSPRTRYPAWLAAALVVIPLLAVLYLVVVPNQPTCGSAGQLAIDPATGVAVACGGGEYGVDDVSNFAIGATVYEASCAVCHGTDGGGGAGPAMAGGAVLAAFPASSCSAQIEWVTLGSSNWPDATYGANDTPVAGGMPGFDGQLTDVEIAQVVLYERVEFGGLEVEPTETECGLGVEEG